MPHLAGEDDGVSYGVLGYSRNARGVLGISTEAEVGIDPLFPDLVGVYGLSDIGVGGGFRSDDSEGVYASSFNGNGVSSYSNKKSGVFGNSINGSGLYGQSNNSRGVHGLSKQSWGVFAESENWSGLLARSLRENGLVAYTFGADKYAAFLAGRVYISGPLELGPGSAMVKMDHPFDPANKYLYHSSVESPDMKNVYDNVAILDQNGEAVIELPDWFSAINKDFRYQLTAIGILGPNLHIAEEISDDSDTNHSNNSNSSSINRGNNCRFKIAGGTLGMRVSWQVTGIRKDPWATAHPTKVEEDKPENERGYYVNPDLYGQPIEKGINSIILPPEKEINKMILSPELEIAERIKTHKSDNIRDKKKKEKR
ncbi:MAG TPA: hypothetical protein VFV86_02720 [Nitrososphaeraceae archaeon]|nr:hypothetical protein [Nitrososphaeraceae archaeon]